MELAIQHLFPDHYYFSLQVLHTPGQTIIRYRIRDLSRMEMTPGAERSITLDACRGAAICAMVAYHFIFDLVYFGIIEADPSFRYIAYPIAGSFIAIAGISLHLKSESLRRQERTGWQFIQPFLRRGFQLLAIGFGITCVTWIYPHEGFIIWGILHALGAATILGIPFLRYQKLIMPVAILIIATWLLFFPLYGPDYLLPLGIHEPGFLSLDYIPLIPWFPVFLLGIAAGSYFFQKKTEKERQMQTGDHHMLLTLLAVPGRHSLAIYLIHQPVIIGLLLLLGSITL